MTRLPLHIQIPDVEGVVFDEAFAGFDDVAHQDVEHFVRFYGVVFVKTHAQELTFGRVHGGFEKLFGVHLTETFESFDLHAAASDF